MEKNIINELDEIVKKETKISSKQKKEKKDKTSVEIVNDEVLEGTGVQEPNVEQVEKKIKIDKFDYETNDFNLILNTIKTLTKDSELEKFFDKLCSNNVFKKNIVVAIKEIKDLYKGEWIDFLLLIYKKMNYCSNDTNIARHVQVYMFEECQLQLNKYNIGYDMNSLRYSTVDSMNRFVDSVMSSEIRIKYKTLDKNGESKIDETKRNAEVIKITFLCLMVANNVYKGQNHQKSLIIERFINDKFAKIEDIYYVNNCTSLTLDAITKVDYKDRLKALKYLYYPYYLESEKLKSENDTLLTRVNNLMDDKLNLKTQNEKLNLEVERFKRNETKLTNEIEDLKTKLEQSEGNAEFNESQLKIQYNSMKQTLLRSLKKELSNEIENINELISNLDDRTKTRIGRQIDIILDTIDEKLGN